MSTTITVTCTPADGHAYRYCGGAVGNGFRWPAGATSVSVSRTPAAYAPGDTPAEIDHTALAALRADPRFSIAVDPITADAIELDRLEGVLEAAEAEAAALTAEHASAATEDAAVDAAQAATVDEIEHAIDVVTHS